MYLQNASPNVCYFLNGNDHLGHLWLSNHAWYVEIVLLPWNTHFHLTWHRLGKRSLFLQSLKHKKSSDTEMMYLVVLLEELGFGKQRMWYL